MSVLVTGCAGFIGYSLSLFLLKKKYKIFGIDNLNNYYDVNLKKDRLKNLKDFQTFMFSKIDITNYNKLNNYIKKNKIKIIVHLAAQAGVRHSINNPDSYFDNNIFGFYNILQASKKNKIKHLIYASSSSVYGKSSKFPTSEIDNTDNPLSFYAASKKCNEVMAYSFSNIYNLPCTGLRFFTVYGPYGRPDMALFKFVSSIVNKKKLKIFNYGKHSRDFTYVEDIVKKIFILLEKPSKNKVPHEIFNLGNSQPISLKKYLILIEKKLKNKAKKQYLGLQKGDVKKTFSNSDKFNKKFKVNFRTDISKGIHLFIDWYMKYNKNRNKNKNNHL
tara:strand:+ start:2030 stop:3022 length:993 start_codon:yes stop_codon:yes gene_type:complete